MESTAPVLLDKARRFRTPKSKAVRKIADCPCLVLLGRAGDIIDSMPIALHYSRLHNRPVPFVTQKQFVGILECTSYCEPIPWEGELYMTVNEAVKWAEQRYETVYCIQTWGHEYNPGIRTKSFCDEHFRLANLNGQRGQLPIIFDRRNGEREEKLLSRYPTDKPIILYNLQGFSSPFQHSELIRQEISRFSGVATLIDTSSFKADCVVDLLALYSVASALITIDTATLHLASACSVPYVALTVDNKKPWHTSPPLGNCRLNVPYSRTPQMLWQIRAVLDALVETERIIAPKIEEKLMACGKIIHVTDSFWMTEPRCARAFQSWAALYKSHLLGADHAPFPWKRDARDIGSKRQLPFLKDLLGNALPRLAPEDYLLWTNSDILLEAKLIRELRPRMARAPIICGRRVDFATGKPHPGRDICAFRVEWLKEHWDEIPDLLCGCAEIDVWMSLAAREQIGLRSETPGKLFQDVEPVDVPPGGAKHIDHGLSPWDTPSARYQEPANIYNMQLLRAWCKTHQPNMKFTRQGFVDWTL